MSVKIALGCSEKVHGGICCDDDVWLHERATMNRAQNSFVDEQLARIQSAHDELRCYLADHKTVQIRPATTYDLTAERNICLLDFRDAPTRELEAIRQHLRKLQPYMLIAQHNDDSLNDESHCALCEQQANQCVISCSICAVAQRNRIRLGTPVWVSGPNCLDSSDRLLKQERISIFTSVGRYFLHRGQRR